jgi:2-polyprenyl-6-methoxyphenol hydroxylase-like FAD-dependent oxidoreductase
MDGFVGERAVVLGGSMAGLLAARVLSDHYASVVVVDRDPLLGVAGARRGVPQGSHAHALLARGQRELDRLFPGFTEEMAAHEMPMVDMGEMHWSMNGLRLKNTVTGLVAVSLTRPALEALVRDRVARIGNVEFRTGVDIVGLTTTEDHARVTGVRIAAHGAKGAGAAAEESVGADLIVDASGKGSRSPLWLKELGYEQPAVDRVKIDLAYTTCEFLLPKRPLVEDLSIIALATPDSPRGAFFGRTQGDRHTISFTSMLGDHPAVEIGAVREFAKSLPVPGIYEAICDAEPISGPVQLRYPESVRSRYERLARFPDGYLVVGDAVCSFNPVYGQGMTVSALEAATLERHLADGRAPRALDFFRDISAVIDAPWSIAAGGDLAWPGVVGERDAMTEMMNAYMAKVMYGMLHDGEITRAFMRVAGLIDPPQSLLRPSLMLRVLRVARLPLPVPGPAESAGRPEDADRALV